MYMPVFFSLRLDGYSRAPKISLNSSFVHVIFHICAEVSQLEVDEVSSSSPELSLNETHKCPDYQLRVDQAPGFLRVFYKCMV